MHLQIKQKIFLLVAITLTALVSTGTRELRTLSEHLIQSVSGFRRA